MNYRKLEDKTEELRMMERGQPTRNLSAIIQPPPLPRGP